MARAGLGDDVLDALVAWLAKQILSDQFAKLEQGGHREGGIPLRKVFVDLPITAVPVHDADARGSGGSGERRLFVRTLLRQKAAPLASPAGRLETRRAPGEPGNLPARERRGFLVVGGPGQGKSTLGQLASQVHRAALLAPFLERLQPAQRDVVRAFTETASRKEIGWPLAPLFPVRIVLPEAAAWLARQDGAAEARPAQLLRLLSAQAESRGIRLSPEVLERLLGRSSLLLVLDGLDEVGAAEDRARLVAATRDLLATLGGAGARGLVVATTRPQGYTGELEGIGVPLTTVYLAPLRRVEALAYGRKLADAKLPGQPDDCARVVRGLESAASEAATARLLTTPLQVTILAALVQRMGRVPSERWGLFERYFETIYDREVERGTYAAPLLRDHRMHIGRIHRRVGLLLQVESESAGGTEARMSRERLEAVADAVLREDDVDEEARAGLVRRVVRAAEERLVFLVEPEPGKFGFEIRSLQEFMAAWALTEEGDAPVPIEERLLRIAKAPTFRAVALFIASKLFTKESSLRALADRVCRALDEDPDDAAARAVRAGAVLALEILEEGSALNQPKYTRQFMERACGLLDLPPCEEQARLARVATGEAAAKVLRAAVEVRLRDPAAGSALGAWVALVAAAELGADWAAETGKAAWQALEDATQVVAASVEPKGYLAGWLADRIEEGPGKVPPHAIPRFLAVPSSSASMRWVEAFIRLNGLSSVAVTSAMPGLTLHWIEVSTARDPRWTAIAAFRDPPAHWRPWVLAAQFMERPTAATLAEALRRLSSEPSAWEQRKALTNFVSWPLAACLTSADAPHDLLSYAALAESGHLGDADEWVAAQGQWQEKVDEEAFLDIMRRAIPWEQTALSSAPPLGGVHFSKGPGIARRGWSSRFRTALEAIRSRSLLPHLISALTILLGRAPREHIDDISWAEVERWSELCGELLMPAVLEGLRSKRIDAWIDGLDTLGRRRNVSMPWHGQTSAIAASLCGIYGEHPDRYGLLYWLRACLDEANSRLLDEGTQSAVLKALAEHPVSEPALRADAALIRLWLGGVTRNEVSALLDTVAAQAAQEPDLWWEVIMLAERSPLPSATREMLLVDLLRRPDLPWRQASSALSALHSSLQTRRTGLADPAAWTRLRLPLPLPLVHTPAQHGFALPESPVVLSRVQVQHIRGVAGVTLELAPPPAPDQGQWVVLLGPNGAGKTTLLRSVVLALRSLSNPKIWPRGTFATPWRANGAPAGPSAITVHLAGGRAFSATVQKNGSEIFAQEPRDQPTPFPIFAYGCRRGSALGGAAREVHLGEDDGPEIATLFDEGAPLVHAETWLKEWDGAAARDPEKNAAVYDAVRRALQELLAVEALVVRDRQVLVSGPSVGTDVPFAALSDGYLTAAGWFLDLVARWIELAHKHLGSLNDGLLRRMTGLVLLDEIDLHLHPRWQLEVIPRVKRLLPKMSFIVTTHNPLTLVGARPEEIWILSLEDGRVRAERGTEAPMLLTGGQIYGRYFGIQDVYPSEIGEALRRYGFLSGDPLRTDEEQAEMARLRATLKANGIEPGWEEVPREAPRPARPRPRGQRAKAAPR
ncbi:AAA family ATPase [Sorangium sp. So ce861]|uniref:AAA family ATPase n=1 Tax=Sorangium sp. So ce861 TaxID=3133323 RepID=UPI003F63E284